MLLTSQKIPMTNRDNFTSLISSRSIFPSPSRGWCSGALSPTSAKRPPGRWRRSTATPNPSRNDGGEQRIWIWIWKWGWFGWGRVQICCLTLQKGLIHIFWQSHQAGWNMCDLLLRNDAFKIPPCFFDDVIGKWWSHRDIPWRSSLLLTHEDSIT